MLDFFDQVNGDLLGAVGLVLAVFSLYLHFKNFQINSKTFKLSRKKNFRDSLEFIHIYSEQKENRFINKLVVFNPSSQGVILQSLIIYKENKVRFPIFQKLGFLPKWTMIKSAWWPAENEEVDKLKYVDEAYEHLFVKDHKTIFAFVEGNIDKSHYMFHLKTSNQFCNLVTTITDTNRQFPHVYTKIKRGTIEAFLFKRYN